MLLGLVGLILRIVTDPARGAVGASAFGGEQRGAGAGVVVVELAPDVLDEPAERAVGAVDQGDHPLARARAPGSFSVPDVELAEAPQVPLDVRQIELARLADPEPDLGHQFGGGVVPGGRGELPAGCQLAAPPGEQRLYLRPRRRNPQCRVLRPARPGRGPTAPARACLTIRVGSASGVRVRASQGGGGSHCGGGTSRPNAGGRCRPTTTRRSACPGVASPTGIVNTP
jgi:hypothetical protein